MKLPSQHLASFGSDVITCRIMINVQMPQLVILAGPNGAGKSTVAEFLIANGSIGDCVNADIIAKGMAAADGRSSDIAAGRILLQVVREALMRRQSVAFESTMSGLTWRKLISDAKALGFEVTICFVAVESADIAVERVVKRVSEGGHNIPEDTIRRRYQKCLRLGLEEYRNIADYWYFFDNSGDNAQLVAARERGYDEVIVDRTLWEEYVKRWYD